MFVFKSQGRTVTVDKPVVMGIINLTSDSFYEKSRVKEHDEIRRLAEKHLNEGATFVDMGGQSTRPGSQLLSADEELLKLIPAIEILIKEFPEINISVDTFYSLVAKEAVNAGAFMINDISAGAFDNNLISTVAELKVPYVLMHMKGTPQTMTSESTYEDVVKEVYTFLKEKATDIKQKGVEQIILDPGFGFAKTADQNFKLLQELDLFSTLEYPILLGISRKSFIYKTLGTKAENSLAGTTFLHAFGLEKGAKILRVHDVKPAIDSITLFEEYIKNKPVY
jgi:dihydropteroate synthase